MKPQITTGDDAILLQELTKYDKVTDSQVTFNIPNSATVKSRIISSDHSETYSSEVTQSENTTGADWANSLIAVVLSSDVTSEILNKEVCWKNGKASAKIETQIDDNGKTTFFSTVTMIKGSIE